MDVERLSVAVDVGDGGLVVQAPSVVGGGGEALLGPSSGCVGVVRVAVEVHLNLRGWGQ